ncbi:MAG TPA: Clp protease N-terminal domain-containing protein, partial [Nocardioidaceae bacterium]|nr:Clp protease N-terminal domain-containing protein [Nocardioidaceae bacterium]
KGHIPYSRDAEKALELSLRETIRLGQKTIQPGHLLLGILRSESPGHALLVQAGVDIVALRKSLEGKSRAA